MRRNWFWMILGLVLLMAVPSDAFAQRRGGRGGRGGGGGRRSSPKASRPKASKPKASKPQRGKVGGKASKKKGSWGSSKKKASKSKKATKEDQKAYDRAKAAGKTAPDRKAAMTKFSKDPANAKKYRSDYKDKPASRPDHVPASYSHGGQTVIINHRAGYGYGHWSGGGMGLGEFIMYSSMADMAMRPYYNRQMASAGYMYGPRPVVASGFGMGSVLIVLIIAGVVLAVVFFPRNRGAGVDLGND